MIVSALSSAGQWIKHLLDITTSNLMGFAPDYRFLIILDHPTFFRY